jgi:hypothetical protein
MFIRRHPRSPVRARVERSCVGDVVVSLDGGQATDR